MKKHPRIAVTDHAVIRYMERVLGLDIEPVRAAIADVAGPAVRTGATAIITDGFRYVVRDGAVAMHDLQISITELKGDLKTMSAVIEGRNRLMERLETIVERHEDHLLDGSKK